MMREPLETNNNFNNITNICGGKKEGKCKTHCWDNFDRVQLPIMWMLKSNLRWLCNCRVVGKEEINLMILHIVHFVLIMVQLLQHKASMFLADGEKELEHPTGIFQSFRLKRTQFTSHTFPWPERINWLRLIIRGLGSFPSAQE